jgi:hypothetical protein
LKPVPTHLYKTAFAVFFHFQAPLSGLFSFSEKKMPIENTDQTKINIPDEGETIGSANDARLKMYSQINDQNDKSLADNGDLADINDDGTTTAFRAEENLTDEEITERELQRAQDEANQTDTDETAPVDAPVKHKLKVNGKELELTTEELIERAQKVESADEYLKEAARLKRETQPQITQPQPSVADDAAVLSEERRALVRAIQMGTEEEAMAAIEKLQARTTPSVNTDDISRAVDERITFNDAVTWFQSEYKDLVSDPTLLNVTLQRDKELLARGDTRSYRERYEEIGKEVRTWRDQLVKAATPAAPPPPDKQARKAAAPVVPVGASTKAPQVADDEENEESVGEIISAMAKARGGPQWLRG